MTLYFIYQSSTNLLMQPCTTRILYVEKSICPHLIIFEFRSLQSHLEITHLAMQSAFIKICERMDLLKELRVGAWYCNKISNNQINNNQFVKVLPSQIFHDQMKWYNCKVKALMEPQQLDHEVTERGPQVPTICRLLNWKFQNLWHLQQQLIYSNTKTALGASYHGFPWLSVSCSLNVDMDQYIDHILQSKVFLFKELL